MAIEGQCGHSGGLVSPWGVAELCVAGGLDIPGVGLSCTPTALVPGRHLPKWHPCPAVGQILCFLKYLLKSGSWWCRALETPGRTPSSTLSTGSERSWALGPQMQNRNIVQKVPGESAQPSWHLPGPGMSPWGQSRAFQEYGHSQPRELSGAISCGALEESLPC